MLFRSRILAPILFLSLLLTGLLVVDQEFLIPRLSGELTRKQDQLPNEAAYDLWFLGDANGSLVCCLRYEEKAQTMHHPLVILREREDADTWRVVGRIQAIRATYDPERKGWVLVQWVKLRVPTSGLAELDVPDDEAVDFYATNLSPRELPLRRREGFKSLLSLRQLTEMERDPGTDRKSVV